MHEDKTWPLIRRRVRAKNTELGGPREVIISHGLASISKPEDHESSVRAKVGLFIDHSAEIPWLLLTFDLSKDTKDPQILLCRTEPDEGWSIEWFETTASTSLVWKGDRLKMTMSLLTKTLMKEMADILSPWEDAAWILGRFLPKRIPGAIRVVTPTHIQVWLRF